MARSIFFSFHYDDVKTFRVNVVRNSNVIKRASFQNVFSDGSLWEKTKEKGTAKLKELIEASGLYQTSVTAVLIGAETYSRRWVRYEIIKSFERGNGLLAIHLNRIRGRDGYITTRGKNPFNYLGLEATENGNVHFYELVNRKWIPFADLPVINNRVSNTVYFKPRTNWDILIGKGRNKFRFYKFSELFNTYCWNDEDGANKFGEWIEDAHGGYTI